MSKVITLLISSGNGPAECCQGVDHVLRVMTREALAQRLEMDVARQQSDNAKDKGTKSAIVRLHGKAATALAGKWLGTIQWVCKSSLRPKHKRQNWFVGVFEMTEAPVCEALDETAIRFEAFRAGGPGGQHQNTTDSAVRATCVKSGISVVARDGRSQHRNKALAVERLKALLAAQHSFDEACRKRSSNLLHHSLERGNPVRRFKGPDFKEVTG